MYFLDPYGRFDYAVRYFDARGTEGAPRKRVPSPLWRERLQHAKGLDCASHAQFLIYFFVRLPQKKCALLSLVETARLGFKGCEVPRRGSAPGPKNGE